MSKVVIALGSNMGDKVANIFAAISKLKSIQNTHFQALSSLYEVEALLPENADESWNQSFINAVSIFETQIAPEDLLVELKSIEREMGRTDSLKWAPRIIDLDILAFEDISINSRNLNIPHHELYNRDFALIPFAEIYPDYTIPYGIYEGEKVSSIATKLFKESKLWQQSLLQF